jgi:hypothetical protein
MTDTPVSVDLNRLRAVANRVERSANALSKFRFPGLCEEDLIDSSVAGLASPALMASRLETLVVLMHGWADAARMSADALEHTEQQNAVRLSES